MGIVKCFVIVLRGGVDGVEEKCFYFCVVIVYYMLPERGSLKSKREELEDEDVESVEEASWLKAIWEGLWEFF